jgi:hypothetical protein
MTKRYGERAWPDFNADFFVSIIPNQELGD